MSQTVGSLGKFSTRKVTVTNTLRFSRSHGYFQSCRYAAPNHVPEFLRYPQTRPPKPYLQDILQEE